MFRTWKMYHLIFCTLGELIPPPCPGNATVQAPAGLILALLKKEASPQESLGNAKMEEMESNSKTGHTQWKLWSYSLLGTQEWLHSLPTHRNEMFNFLPCLVQMAQAQGGGAGPWGKFFEPKSRQANSGRASLEWSFGKCFINIRWWVKYCQSFRSQASMFTLLFPSVLFLKSMLILGSPHLSLAPKNWRNERHKQKDGMAHHFFGCCSLDFSCGYFRKAWELSQAVVGQLGFWNHPRSRFLSVPWLVRIGTTVYWALVPGTVLSYIYKSNNNWSFWYRSTKR